MIVYCKKMNLPEPEYRYNFSSVLSDILNIGRDTINEHISKLKSDNGLERVCGRKDGQWKVLK